MRTVVALRLLGGTAEFVRPSSAGIVTAAGDRIRGE
jgi:hypothetical protein